MTIEQRIKSAQNYFLSRQVFSADPLQDLVIPNPSEGVLASLKRREREERISALDTEEVNFAVNLAELRGTSWEINKKIEARVAEETVFMLGGQEVLGEFTKLGLDQSVKISWGIPIIVNGYHVGGRYLYEDRHIEVSKPCPTPAQRIQSLAISGNLEAADDIFIHEATHAVQFAKSYGRIFSELIEAQAYRAMQDTVTEFSHDHLVDHVTKDSPYTYIDKRKFNAAVWFIDRFNALGLTQVEIIELINKPGSWNELDGVWRTLEHVLRFEMEEKGLGEDELNRAVMAGDLAKVTERYKARRIAQEILYERFMPEIEERRSQKRWQNRRRDAIELGTAPAM